MTFDPLTGTVVLILFGSTLVRSTFGFGDALIAMPLLSMAVGVKTASPLVALVAVIIAVTIVFRDWRDIQLKSAATLVIAACFGLPIGLVYLSQVNEQIIDAVLAGLIITFSLYSLFRPRLIQFRDDRWAWLFGFCAGILGGAYNTHGPPLAIYGTIRGWSPSHFRATLQGYFLPAGTLVAIGHMLDGNVSSKVQHYFVWSIPAVVVAMLFGRFLSRRIRNETFMKSVYYLLIVVGLGLMVKAVSM